MIRLPSGKEELAFLEKLLPDLEARPDLGHLAIEIKKRIDRIRQEIPRCTRGGGQNPKPTYSLLTKNRDSAHWPAVKT